MKFDAVKMETYRNLIALTLIVSFLSACITGSGNFNVASVKVIETQIFDKDPKQSANGVVQLSKLLFSVQEYCEKPVGDIFYRFESYNVATDGFSKKHTITSEIKLFYYDGTAQIITIDGDFAAPDFISGGVDVGSYKNAIIKQIQVNGKEWYAIYIADKNTPIDYKICDDVKYSETPVLPSRLVLINNKTALDKITGNIMDAVIML